MSRVTVDVNTFIGGHPFRHVPHPEPAVLARVLEREGVQTAWVGHLPGAFHRDPAHANRELLQAMDAGRGRLRAAPIVRPDWPRWMTRVRELRAAGAVAIRAWPQLWSFGPGDPRLRELASACAAEDLPLVLTVRFEDQRQRHPLDVAPDLSAAHVRELARARTGARVVLTAAGREMIEEIHWGLTPEERDRVFYDISWIWGPPVDELSHLFRTIGAGRFLFGTMWPLRLVQGPSANLDLLESDVADARLADPSTW
ncbi:MAG: hypothetical protein IT361_08220 [Gemmatimonadaceae bacterium]|nr:hypothetical protein [Gemmatimonadaceae bacterium]